MPNSSLHDSPASDGGLGPFARDFLRIAYLLLNARQLAEHENRPVWDFALEISDLLQAGFTHQHLRWLSAEHLAEFAEEIGRPGKSLRKFRPLAQPVISFPEKTCCVLTDKGMDRFSRLRNEGNDVLRRSEDRFATSSGPHASLGVADVPFWDGVKDLYFRGTLLHKFKQPAPHQKAILSAFQEPC